MNIGKLTYRCPNGTKAGKSHKQLLANSCKI